MFAFSFPQRLGEQLHQVHRRAAFPRNVPNARLAIGQQPDPVHPAGRFLQPVQITSPVSVPYRKLILESIQRIVISATWRTIRYRSYIRTPSWLYRKLRICKYSTEFTLSIAITYYCRYWP